MRNMSFIVKIKQMYAETTTVTRRKGWGFLKPGDIVMAVEKGMGLKRGEKIKQIYPIEIVSVREEPLWHITPDDVIKEGFPDKDTDWFINMFCKLHKGCVADTVINRIEFKKFQFGTYYPKGYYTKNKDIFKDLENAISENEIYNNTTNVIIPNAIYMKIK